MPETRRRFDPEFRQGAVRIVRETNKPIARVADELAINPGTLGNWVNQDRANRGESDALTTSSARPRRCSSIRTRGAPSCQRRATPVRVRSSPSSAAFRSEGANSVNS